MEIYVLGFFIPLRSIQTCPELHPEPGEGRSRRDDIFEPAPPEVQ
jgi:hypothetical protein